MNVNRTVRQQVLVLRSELARKVQGGGHSRAEIERLQLACKVHQSHVIETRPAPSREDPRRQVEITECGLCLAMFSRFVPGK